MYGAKPHCSSLRVSRSRYFAHAGYCGEVRASCTAFRASFVSMLVAAVKSVGEDSALSPRASRVDILAGALLLVPDIFLSRQHSVYQNHDRDWLLVSALHFVSCINPTASTCVRSAANKSVHNSPFPGSHRRRGPRREQCNPSAAAVAAWAFDLHPSYGSVYRTCLQHRLDQVGQALSSHPYCSCVRGQLAQRRPPQTRFNT